MILSRAVTRSALKTSFRAIATANPALIATARGAGERKFSTARDDHHDDHEPPKKKNVFGAKYDWQDPLNFKSLLTEDEVG